MPSAHLFGSALCTFESEALTLRILPPKAQIDLQPVLSPRAFNHLPARKKKNQVPQDQKALRRTAEGGVPSIFNAYDLLIVAVKAKKKNEF